MTTRHGFAPSPLGELMYAAEGNALVAVYFPKHEKQPVGGFGAAVTLADDSVLSRAAQQLGEYFAGTRHEFDLELAPRGEEFQQRVWRLLLDIPYGETTSYGAIATELGDPGLAQAVGGAVGRNPLSIVIPCHRVVGSDGRLTGYAGGIERKIYLLDHEEPPERAAQKLF
ncbi:methylated-DNA-[protein]-cysteine S-methyltransferase [Homoserinimonas aerilata]|uniref:Methylated-DNA--protein-cysteine methyltransferase n=1 Tax=Homoserinimonas aerilata TaxID=1162970 RepID=A0A542YGI4_9MICO|nr:methylated-DNA--[protein]-cysteine S-methyltransferase [Homoserinimonas aerilata]TQL47187.1 methylated-DNA-[protein]-cysteine S-methyltransferase [Homoserinimonas aerilata]